MNSRLKLNIYELLLIYVAFVGLASITLLALSVFKPVWALFIGIPLTLLAMWTFKVRVEVKDSRFTWVLLLLLLGALAFRVPPYLYLMGGQDQGTYINISKQYETQGTLYYMDYFRESLNGAQKKIYDKMWENLMPSFEKWSRPGSENTMKFYPMHPAFLAIVGNVFGSDNRVYSLTFFSLISLVNIYLIVTALSKSRKAGYISVVLLGLNPLHVFFSKMPVGEITALAFASAGFYFLIKFLGEFKPVEMAREVGSRWFERIYLFVVRQPALLYLSSLMFFAFMFTRMTFFMYLLLLFLVALGAVLFSSSKQLKAYLILFVGFLSGLFLVSLGYYFKFIRPLFDMIFATSVEKAINKILFFVDASLIAKTGVLIAFCIGFVLLAWLAKSVLEKRTTHYSKIIIVLGLLGVAALLVYAVDINMERYYRLAVRGIKAYERWNISGQGLNSLKNITMVSIVNHISWFGALLYISYFVYALFKKKVSLSLFSAFFVFSFFLVIYSVNITYMRYDYYNSRYFLSEVIPAFVVFASVYLYSLLAKKNNFLKGLAVLFLVLTSAYYLLFSSIQFMGPELADPKFYKDIVSEVSGKNTLMVLVNLPEENKYSMNFNGYVFGPFKYYYNFDTIAVSSVGAFSDPDFIELTERYEGVYVLSNGILDFEGSGIEAVSSEIKFLTYSHYNNSPGCGFHNYEFLRVINSVGVGTSGDLRCSTLPNTYFVRGGTYFAYSVLVK